MRGRFGNVRWGLLVIAVAMLLPAAGCVAARVSNEGVRLTPPDSYYEDTRAAEGGSATTAVGKVLAASDAAGATQAGGPKRTGGSQGLALLRGEVTYVVDGDTVHVKLKSGKIEKVRLIGVDTPESVIEHEPYGAQAASYTRTSLLHRTVYIETDMSQRDSFGRMLAYVWTAPPSVRTGGVSHRQVAELMFNAWLVADGYAQISTVPPNVKYADDFRALERFARARNVGLWNPKVLSQKTPSNALITRASGPAGTKRAKAVGEVIGNCNSLKFHRPDCPAARKIATSHRLAFESRRAAKASGYRPCKICRP